MAGETSITLVGNLVEDPDLRFTPSGAAVSNFRVATTPRTFNKQTNEWQDGEPMFLSCSIWRDAAEHTCESLRKGDRVIVVGKLKARSYENNEGQRRTVFEVDVDEVGPSLKFRTVLHSDGAGRKVTRQSTKDEGDPWRAPPQSEDPPF